jgi:mannose-6-phosphate isomerase-like protein (cupin superfamily)
MSNIGPDQGGLHGVLCAQGDSARLRAEPGGCIVSAFVAAGDGELLTDEARRRVEVKADRDELALTESRYAEGESGPGAHFHREHSDCFYVLQGRLVFELDGERIEGNAGDFVAVPPRVVHTFRNEGPGDTRFLNIHAPSKDFIRHLREGGGDDQFDTYERSETEEA